MGYSAHDWLLASTILLLLLLLLLPSCHHASAIDLASVEEEGRPTTQPENSDWSQTNVANEITSRSAADSVHVTMSTEASAGAPVPATGGSATGHAVKKWSDCVIDGSRMISQEAAQPVTLSVRGAMMSSMEITHAYLKYESPERVVTQRAVLDLMPSHTVRLTLPGENLADVSAVVVPSVRAQVSAVGAVPIFTALSVSVFPLRTSTPEWGVSTWLTLPTVHCDQVDVPCTLPASLRPPMAVATPSVTMETRNPTPAAGEQPGSDVVFLGLAERDTGNEDAVYVWRNNVLRYVRVTGRATRQGPSLLLASSTATRTYPGVDYDQVGYTVVGLSARTLTGTGGSTKTVTELWRLDFTNNSSAAVVAHWSHIVTHDDIGALANVLNGVDLFVHDNQVFLFSRYTNGSGQSPNASNCQLWAVNLTARSRSWSHVRSAGASLEMVCMDRAQVSSAFLDANSLLMVLVRNEFKIREPLAGTRILTCKFSKESSPYWVELPMSKGNTAKFNTSKAVAAEEDVYIVSDEEPYAGLHVVEKTQPLASVTSQAQLGTASFLAAQAQFTYTEFSAPTLDLPRLVAAQPPFLGPLLDSNGNAVLFGGKGWYQIQGLPTLATELQLDIADGILNSGAGRSQIQYTRRILSSEFGPANSTVLLQGMLFVSLQGINGAAPGNGEATGNDEVTGNGACECSAVAHGGVTALSAQTKTKLSSSLYCYHVSTHSWHNVAVVTEDGKAASSGPTPRFAHMGFAVNASAFVVAGGIVSEQGRTADDVWMFGLRGSSSSPACSGVWYKMTAASTGISMPRIAAASVTVLDGNALLYGGFSGARTSLEPLASLLQLSIHASSLTYRLHAVPVPTGVSEGRMGHALIPYTANSLLLYGGWARGYEESRTAHLLRYSTAADGKMIIDTVSAFFRHEFIGGLNVVPASGGHVVLAASSNIGALDGRPPIQFLAGDVCLAGQQYNQITGMCDACPAGTYNSDGRACVQCQAGLVTAEPSSTSAVQCTPCTPAFCNNHGRCSVVNNQPVCTCSFGYAASDNCEAPYIVITMVIGLVVAGLVLLGFGVRYTKRKQAAHRLSRELRASQKRVSKLVNAWRVSWSELRMRHLIARGGFGQVWLAELNDIDVVVKKLQEHCLNDESSLREFQREAELMRMHRHPNLVLFLGAGTDPSGEPFIVMQYAKRGSLKSLLADKSAVVRHDDRLRFMLDAARGMAYLHDCDPAIVHRDLKASNLLVTERFVVKVADFGTARLISCLDHRNRRFLSLQRRELTEQPLSWTTAAAGTNCQAPLLMNPNSDVTFSIGTLQYQSPEMMRQLPYGTSSDIYSFGLVLWEAYERNSPFAEYRFMHMVQDAVLNGQRPSVPTDMPPEYAALMRQCWHGDPNQRPRFGAVVEQLNKQLLHWC
ncbi:uncharacterized protein LOC135822669 [Sycon ciliatum]|uniref:uncharacterized protein LOC135822669 n=1 Tax=Sycon ciliatum TaxID=27933 RepID=UPI0031F638F9